MDRGADSTRAETTLSEPNDFELVSGIVRRRETKKVLGQAESRCELPAAQCADWDSTVRESLRTAGYAPFHYERDADGIAEPWRAHVLWQSDCRKVAREMSGWVDSTASVGKLPAMLSACGASVIVNWLPQFRHLDSPKPEQVRTDDEHLAAASAMVQNLLLLLTAAGMGSYWSSGGQFRSPGVFTALGISTSESLLGVIFIEYPGTFDQPLERKPGKHRGKRTDRWIREIDLGE